MGHTHTPDTYLMTDKPEASTATQGAKSVPSNSSLTPPVSTISTFSTYSTASASTVQYWYSLTQQQIVAHESCSTVLLAAKDGLLSVSGALAGHQEHTDSRTCSQYVL